MSRHWGVSRRARWSRRLLLAALGAVTLVVGQVASGISAGYTLPPTAAAASGSSGHPDRFVPGSVAKSVNHLPPPPPVPSGPRPPDSGPRIPPVPMKATEVPLDPVTGAHFAGSDGVLEVTVPAGAVPSAGQSLLVRQVLPASGSNAGGSGHYTFGTWLLQVVDSAGRPAASGLRRPLTLKLHVGARARALDLGRVMVNVNPSLPSWVDLAPSSVAGVTPASGARKAAPPGGSSPKPVLGAPSRTTATLDASSTTLSASLPATSPSTAASFDTFAPVATFGKPDPFETDLSAGALSAGIQLDLPAGPGGLTPPLRLAYNSAGVSDQHNPQGAAPWVGEGWNLGLGSISWAEHQVDLTGCQDCSTTRWEDSWQLSDPFGTAADLVPPFDSVSTYNDDTTNPITPSPVTWHTAPETRAKVISFLSPSPPSPPPGGWSPVPPCFRVFLPSGIMEELGCTPDSLQFYRPASGTSAGEIFLSNWLLDLITDPQGNQVHVTYQQDMESGFNGQGYPRDAVPATVEWDSPGCHSQQTACTGGNWTPLMRVSFAATHSVAHVSGSSCAANVNLRCDDPVDLSGNQPAGLPAPLVQSTFVLSDAAVQVRGSGSAGWSTLRDYQFSYDQAGPTTIADPWSGTQESTAGSLLLTRLQVLGADGATALPPRTFGYTPVTEYYEDVTKSPLPADNCGPSWNNGVKPGKPPGCDLWSKSYAGNSSYLSSVSNGLGLQQTFSWLQARNNFYGMVSGSSPADPFACNNGSVQSTFPCNMPDNQTWSRAVLTQRQDTTNGITSTWAYGYQVQYPLAAQECSGCVASFYWGNQNDFDQQDFYNNKFMGFAQASVSNPDGSLEIHKFLTTQGFGLYDISQTALHCDTPAPCHNDSYALLGNAAHGHEYELDQYDTDGHTLLKQVKTQWQANCPPAGVGPSPPSSTWGDWDGNLVVELDESNPVMDCEIHPLQVDQLTYDGAGTGTVPDRMTTYSYDGLGRVSSQTTRNTTGVFDLSGNANHAIWSGGVGFGLPGLVSGDSDTAASFDGGTGSVSTSVVNQQVLSVEAWFKLTSLPPSGSNPRLVASSHTDIDLTGFQMEINSGGAGGFVDVGTANGHFVATWTQQLVVGTPYHYVMTYDGFNVKAYLNGTQVGSTAAGGAVVPSLLPVTIGRDPAFSSGGWFGGTLDDVAIYSTALPAARVQVHAGAGPGYAAAVQADSPLAYYRLDDGRVGTASPNAIVNSSGYIQNDGVVASATGANGPYLLDRTAFGDTEDTGGNRYQCAYQMYDGQTWASGQQPTLTLGELTNKTSFTGCGTPAQGFADQSGPITTTNAYDVFGNLTASADPDANGGVGGHAGCTVGSIGYSSCTTFDGTFGSLPRTSANALNQLSTTSYLQTTVADASGHGNLATPGGNLTYGQPGLVSGNSDTAIGFDGASTSVTGPTLTPLQGDNTRSVELWFRTLSTNQQTLFSSGLGGVGAQVARDFDILLVKQGGVGGNPPVNTPGLYLSYFFDDVYLPGLNLTDGRPHHVVATLSGASVFIYVDGTTPSGLVTSGSGWSGMTSQPFTLPLTPNTAGNPVLIGQATGGGGLFSGTIGEVAVYGAALSASRVQAHFTAASGYQAAVAADAPAAYWRLNDVSSSPSLLADATGHGNSAYTNGGVTFESGSLLPGDTDPGASFDGSTGYLTTPLTGAGSALTVETWFKLSSIQNGVRPRVVASSHTDIDFKGFQLELDPSTGTGFADVGTGSAEIRAGWTQQLTAGSVYHYVMTYDGTTLRAYLNGTQVASAAGSGAVAPALPVTIGRDPAFSSADGFFPGTIDEVAVYPSALPASRVLAHYTAAAGYKAAVLADSPTAYYRLDDVGAVTGANSGFGLWPLSATDANNQTSTTIYDPLGRVTGTIQPGETAGLATTNTTYTVWCASGAQTPCVEIDKTQRLNATTTATSRAFYDGLGHLVETRSSAPGGQDVVQYSSYDAGQRLAFQSVPYMVAAYTGGPGPAAYSTPVTQAGTIYDLTQGGITLGKYDGLGRSLVSTDAMSNTSSRSYSIICAPADGGGDPGCYEKMLSIDGNGHQTGMLVDALGRTAYERRYTGNSSSTYQIYATAKYSYDFVGHLTKIIQPDGVTQTTFGYDMVGRKTLMNDPDLGQQLYPLYDPNGNLRKSVDARGSTTFMQYDGLNRPIWRNTTDSATGAYDTYSYDSTAGGNQGIGRLTSETFATGALSGSYTYTYDGRGQETQSALTVGGSSYPLGSSYDDVGNVLAQTYPDGETVTNSYTAQGWLSGVSTSQGATTLASNLSYTGTAGGAFGEITGASLGNGTYTYSATYDPLDRATDLKTTKTSGGAVMFEQQLTNFDGAGNVLTEKTTMPGGTDNQSFCYDEQNRLTWASAATATPPCSSTQNQAGTLSAALYTQTFGYDVMGRLTSGPLGTYTYGDPAHNHAATAIGTAWSAVYDAAGNMTCRAPTSSTTCAGTPTGAKLDYNNEGELQSWQNAPTSPTTTAQFLYDGQGQRVEQSVTQGGTTTSTVYVGNVEEISTTGGTSTTTAYYYMAGKRIGLSVNGTVSYLASDGLGSATVTLSTSGTATAAQLFAPYGGVRYSTGTMPTTYGFTGQRSDSPSGLDYYGARYYDPLAGQFASGDSVLPGGGFDLWGLSRYAYVEGNPENGTDPTGHINLSVGDDGSAVPIDNAFQGTYSWGSSPVIRNYSGFTHPYPASRSVFRRWTPTPSRCCSTPAPRPTSTTKITATPPKGPACCTTILPELGNRIGTVITQPLPDIFQCCSTPLPGPRDNTMFEDPSDADNTPVANDPPTDVGGIIGPGGQNIGRPGRSRGVREVDTEEEIEAIFGVLSKGGEEIENSYPGDLVKHPDGTTVGRRQESASGGPTIDITLPDGTSIKVHLP